MELRVCTWDVNAEFNIIIALSRWGALSCGHEKCSVLLWNL